MNSSNIETKANGLNSALFATMLLAGSMNAIAIPSHHGPDALRYSIGQNLHYFKGASRPLWRSTWSDAGDAENRSGKGTEPIATRDAWAQLRHTVELAGIDVDRSELIYRIARQFIDAREIQLVDVQARLSVDPEEGVSYAAIRFLADMEFEAAMEADWEMASEILEHNEFPEGLTVSLRSIA
ncbi:hypothetical protein [Cupriavidus sp. AU9028]|uniref:hypothetical protein n=1 Tax=Cupriavidus sp. AU9028 TaxID=2871157 RepID=UPI001C95A4E8|nr:hypothetical protein [Cupriavidus sp. AU9028]MBY4898846.1 hypothetical protein [Cupriavidus sp. AU9028]